MEIWPRPLIAADLIPTAGTNLFCTKTFTTGFNQQSACNIKKRKLCSLVNAFNKEANRQSTFNLSSLIKTDSQFSSIADESLI